MYFVGVRMRLGWAWLWALVACSVGGTYATVHPLPCPQECECYFTSNTLFKADCSNQNLDQLPLGFDMETQVLDLSNNRFSVVPRNISNFSCLESLNISGNQLNALSENSLLHLEALSELDLSRNQFLQWSSLNPTSVFQSNVNLKKLILSKNPFNTFSNLRPNEYLVSESLEILELNDCGITAIHGKSPLAGLSKLKHLSLAHNPLKVFQKLSSHTLNILDVSYCKLIFIGPDDLNLLIALEHLNMSHNYVLSLSKTEFPTSNSLKTIDISFCNMNRISLDGFPNLEVANVRGNMIRHVMPKEFINNSFLMTLDLSSNAISSIHKRAFEGLHFLRYLNLSINVIPNIHDETFNRLSNLTVINLSRNYLSNMGVLKSPSLKSIDMSFCEIPTINSMAFEDLPMLEHINLSRNIIESIPDYLSSLSLRELDLSYNRLTTITNETFCSLPELEVLYLIGNRFTETWKADYFQGNPNLEKISIYDNTWRCDCYEEGMKGLFEYLTNDPPKIQNIDELICHSPSNVSRKNWVEACYDLWIPNTNFNQNQRIMTVVLITLIAFFAFCFVVSLIRRAMKMRLRTIQEETDRQNQQARDRLREMRMRREQEQQRNAPDPRDLTSPPSYDEALLMPRLDGSFHSLAGVGISEEKKQKKKARRRTRSSGDMDSEYDRSAHRRRQRRQSTAEEETPAEEATLTAHQSEGNLQEVQVVQHLHESDL